MSAAPAAGSGLEWTSYVPFFILPSCSATKTYRVMQQHIAASPCNARRQSACVEDPSGLPSWSSTRCTSPCCSGSCTASSNMQQHIAASPCNARRQSACVEDPSGLPSWSSTRCTSPCCSGSCTASSNARTPRSIMPANCVNMTALLSDEAFPCTQPTFGYAASG